MKRILYFLFSLLIAVLTVVCDANAANSEADRNAAFKLTMLDVGQGLSVLIEADGRFMIYDGGNREYSSYVVSYLKRHRISNIEYLIASHYDEDHIAGLIGILRTASVGTAIIPQYEADTRIYESFMEAVQTADSVVYASAGNSYKLGKATVDILYACNGTEQTENNMSTVIKVSYGGFSCILTGDAEYDTENVLVQNGTDLQCNLYVVGHHGSYYSSSEQFVKAMRPEIAFIGVGAGNKYGHPTEQTLAVLDANGAAVYRTDLQGEISLYYDGSEYKVVTERDLQRRNQATGNIKTDNMTYVLNESSMRFHLPECEAVYKMAYYNRKHSRKSREDLIAEGYSPCGACNP